MALGRRKDEQQEMWVTTTSLPRVHDRLPLEVHAAVFEWALRLVAEKGLLPGKTAAIDSTFLGANVAMSLASVRVVRLHRRIAVCNHRLTHLTHRVFHPISTGC